MWPFGKQKFSHITLSNTLTQVKEEFVPLRSPTVRMYSCGPTVYGPQHLGNLRAAIFSDTIARILVATGYKVRRVINITDVGHLVGDGDAGIDKMSVGAKRDNASPKEIADRYTRQYLDNISALNMDITNIRFPRATDYIQDQIHMIQTLERKGHTYTLPDGVYFDTSTFPDYGKLGARNKVELEAGARITMVEGKKNPQDFVLWRKAKPEDLQRWKSPWGTGNPGWSIECSAMIHALLGDTIDIHTGGEDHISTHHNNEIAQSGGATGKPLARFWLHNAFLTIDGQKISKSLGNVYVLDDVKKHGIHPLALRYLFLQAHYRTPLSFTWESLEAAQEALIKLWLISHELSQKTKKISRHSLSNEEFLSHVRDDLSTPKALAFLWEKLHSNISNENKRGLLIVAESVCGLALLTPPVGVRQKDEDVAKEREEARKRKDFAKADTLRIHMEKSGYRVYDGATSTTYIKIT